MKLWCTKQSVPVFWDTLYIYQTFNDTLDRQ